MKTEYTWFGYTCCTFITAMYQPLNEHGKRPDIHIDENTPQVRIAIPSDTCPTLPHTVLIQGSTEDGSSYGSNPQDVFVYLEGLQVFGIRNKKEVSRLFPLDSPSPAQKQQQETLELYFTTLL